MASGGVRVETSESYPMGAHLAFDDFWQTQKVPSVFQDTGKLHMQPSIAVRFLQSPLLGALVGGMGCIVIIAAASSSTSPVSIATALGNARGGRQYQNKGHSINKGYLSLAVYLWQTSLAFQMILALFTCALFVSLFYSDFYFLCVFLMSSLKMGPHLVIFSPQCLTQYI